MLESSGSNFEGDADLDWYGLDFWRWYRGAEIVLFEVGGGRPAVAAAALSKED